MMVGASLSLTYRTATDDKAVKGSATPDLEQADCAAAADVFVTHDKELTFLLNRISVKGFRVLRLSELFNEIDLSSAGT
jgi:hypothetical protein